MPSVSDKAELANNELKVKVNRAMKSKAVYHDEAGLIIKYLCGVGKNIGKVVEGVRIRFVGQEAGTILKRLFSLKIEDKAKQGNQCQSYLI